MKFGYFESQKPTRDKCSRVIGVAEAGFNISFVAVNFDIHKTIAYRINKSFLQIKLAGDRPRSDRQQNTNSTGGMFHSEHIKTGENSLWITSRNCLWYVSIYQNHPEPSQIHVDDDQNIDILSFWKHFMTGTALHTNENLQQCMLYLVLNKIVIAFTVKNYVLISTRIPVINMRICNVLLNFFVSVYVMYFEDPDRI